MKSTKRTFLTAYKIVAILVVLVLLYNKSGYSPTKLDLVLLVGLLSNGIITFVKAYRRDRDERLGFPVDDEMSNKLKYKAGYYAFFIMFPVWIAVYVFNKLNPEKDWMIGTAILFSMVIYIIAKMIIKHRIDAE